MRHANSLSKLSLVFLALAAIMAATRYHHFGDALHLPDASLAVFFIAGVLVPGAAMLPLLLIEAGMIDYLAITQGGVSDWCVTPAYWFLIPTYGVLWLAGRWYARRLALSWRSGAALFVSFAVSVSVAFLVSNGSFYTLSGYFSELSWTQYAARVAKYYPPYALNALAYVCIAAFIYAAVQTLSRRQDAASAARPHE